MPIQGLVKWFDPKKGYGFLVGPDGQDVFVHYSQILGEGFRTLADGESVDYDLIHGNKGFQAQNVLAAARDDDASPATAAASRPVDDESEAQRQHAQSAAADDDDGDGDDDA